MSRPACTPDEPCKPCRSAALCERGGEYAAAHAYRLLCKGRRAQRVTDIAHLYTEEAARAAVLDELTSLTTPERRQP